MALIAASVRGFALTAAVGNLLVPLLRALVPPEKENGPNRPEEEPPAPPEPRGLPTMGGLCFIFAGTVAVALAVLSLLHSAPDMLGGPAARSLYIAMFSAFAFGMVGFLDDFIKVVKKRNLGLRAMQKIVAQLLITTALLFALHMNGTLTTFVTLPGLGYVDLGLLYYPLSYGLIIGIVNAVNLTDGIDGLCSCVTFVAMLGFLTLTSPLGEFNLSLFAAAMAGALTGFLFWNFYPAKTFMGDTGSMFLGGAVAGIAYAMGRPELIFFFGAGYTWDATTVVIQVCYF